jgi:hypothetical protein
MSIRKAMLSAVKTCSRKIDAARKHYEAIGLGADHVQRFIR